jgi:type I restriction enzyme S subunit
VTGSFGISAIVDFEEPFVSQRHIAIMKPDPSKTDPRFMLRLLAAPQVIDQALSVATGTAQKTVPLSGLRKFLLPCPSLAEQCEVVRRIEAAFTWIERLAAEATSARKLIDHLDQAVLAKAFRGELVSQDLTDEPANILLDRIKAERQAAPQARRKASAGR